MASSSIVRIPTSNVQMNGDYTGVIQVGSNNQPITVVLDTGSSTLGLGLHAYDATNDTAKQVTDFMQIVAYGGGNVGWYGPVLETQVTIGTGEQVLRVPRCNVAVAAVESQTMFRNSGGILGLAYVTLNNAYKMPGPTWPRQYNAKQIQRVGQETDLTPYFTQLTQTAGIADMFAFYARRSWPNLVNDDPTTDPLNHGWLVLGGGPENTDLYSGAFQNAKVVGDDFYDTNLRTVIVGNQPPITVPPAPLAGPGTVGDSNSVVDSGTNRLLLDAWLFTAVVKAFNVIDPAFMALIQQGGTQANGAQGSVPNDSLHLDQWPTVQLVLEGDSGADVVLNVTPATYWQMNAIERGQAAFTVSSGGQGRSTLGLPLLNNYFTVFDQTGSGTVRFAAIKQPGA